MAITLVQGWQETSAAGTSLSLSFSSDVTAGNFLAFATYHIVDAGTPTLSTDQSDTVSLAVKGDQSSGKGSLHYAENAVGGTTQVTITPASFDIMALTIAEYSDLKTSGSIDQTSTQTSDLVFVIASGTITTTQADELLIGVGWAGLTSTPFSEKSGWTERIEFSDSRSLNVQDRILTATGTHEYETTADDDAVRDGGIASFKAAVAGDTAALTGTVTAGIDEEDISAGGKTIILTLSGTTWVAG